MDHASPATTLPNNIEVLLHAARILLGYGRHLIDTIRQRAAAPNFNAIAACFGTANLTTILAHLNRGILRCHRARACPPRPRRHRRGHPLHRAPHPHACNRSPPRQAPNCRNQPPPPLPTRRPTSRASRPAGWDDPELFMPTAEDLERQMRRRPIGRIFLDICLDLAVVPGFCHGAFWNALFEIMTYFGSGVPS